MLLGVEVGLSPSYVVLNGDPPPPQKGGGTAAPTLRPMSVVARVWPISATAELLFFKLFSLIFLFFFWFTVVDLAG